MAATGKQFIAHTKANSPSPHVNDGFGLAPHPLRVTPGQCYWPRAGRRRRSFEVGRVDAGTRMVWGRYLDGAQETVRVSETSLLARRADGQGHHFAFVGYSARRYRTWAVLADVDVDPRGRVVLILPEWHPRRPVSHAARLLPAVGPGTWMTCTADLSHSRAARLNVAALAACRDPGPGRCHRARFAPPVRAVPRPVPAFGVGCGDIVYELPAGTPPGRPRAGGLDVFCPQPPDRVGAGGRVYLARGGPILEYLAVTGVRSGPNGVTLCCRPEPVRLAQPIAVPDDTRVQSRWRWRWWPRALEQTAAPGPPAVAAGDDVATPPLSRPAGPSLPSH